MHSFIARDGGYVFDQPHPLLPGASKVVNVYQAPVSRVLF